MDQQETIDILIDLSLDAFVRQLKPDEYARVAAHKAAYLAAAKHCKAVADLAALTAASTFLLNTTYAINYTVRVTDKANQTLASERDYLAEVQSYTSDLPILKSTAHSFLPLVESLDKAITLFEHTISSTFQTTIIPNESDKKKARQAAHYVYADTYATTRAAYVRAIFIANQIKEVEQRRNTFKRVMITRLNMDLSYDLIQPGFVLNMMQSIITRVIALLLLLGGVVAILIGAFNIASTPLIPIEGVGSACVTLSVGLLSGHFFSQQQCNKMVLANQNRAELSLIA